MHRDTFGGTSPSSLMEQNSTMTPFEGAPSDPKALDAAVDEMVRYMTSGGHRTLNLVVEPEGSGR